MNNTYLAVGSALVVIGLALAARRRKAGATAGAKSGHAASILFVSSGAVFIGVALFKI